MFIEDQWSFIRNYSLRKLVNLTMILVNFTMILLPVQQLALIT